MLNRTFRTNAGALALAIALTAAPLSLALADGGGSGAAASGGVGDAGPNGTASPRSKVGADATRGHVAAARTLSSKNTTTPLGGSHGSAGSGNTGSANVMKSGSTTSE